MNKRLEAPDGIEPMRKKFQTPLLHQKCAQNWNVNNCTRANNVIHNSK